MDPNFDSNYSIRWASREGYTEVVKQLLNDPRVDPSDFNNCCIGLARANGHKEVVKLLLSDKRVRDKLTEEEINKYNKYTNEIS
jgi:hypothetical protein